MHQRDDLNKPDFRTVTAGVRPARIAVLLDENDSEWQHTCRRVIECLSATWGGRHSIIIPTDGTRISDVFWKLLDAFDPDYICEYHKTGKDFKLAVPDTYGQWLAEQLKRESPHEEPSPELRASIDHALSEATFPGLDITPELNRDLKGRLAPFFHEDQVIQHSFSVHTEPGYPLTAVSTVLPHGKRPDRLLIPITDGADLPPLWVESISGGIWKEQADKIAACGVHVEEYRIDAEHAYTLAAAQLNERARRPTLLAGSPFAFSMVGASQYLSLSERSWKLPAVIVAGSTFQDFALYFGLSRIRPAVLWYLPSWLNLYRTAKARVAGGGAALSGPERILSRISNAIMHAVHTSQLRGIEFVSCSLDKPELLDMIQEMSAAANFAIGASLEARSTVRQDLDGLFSNPRVVFNTDNFEIPTTQQVLEGKAVGFFPTPKPKGFSEIVPYDHRWIAEIRVEGLAYPRHPVLGEWLVRHRLLGTMGARTGKDGLSYFCPNIGYFGGDVDTILVRPELHLPSTEQVFRRLTNSAKLSCKVSDKGFFSRDFVRKMGSLEHAAALIREPPFFKVLSEYLKDKKSSMAAGIYLASDRRRYLKLADIAHLVGSDDTAGELVDLLIRRGVFQRGTVLKCQDCRTTDWVSPHSFADEYECRRCGRVQPVVSQHMVGHREPAWYYRLHEMTFLGMANDMHVPFLTLDYLRRTSTTFSYADELEVWKPNLPRPFIEVDICCICDGVLTIGETKKTDRIEGGGARERRSLAKYRETADLLGVRRFLMATSNKWTPETMANAQAAFRGSRTDVVFLTAAEIG